MNKIQSDSKELNRMQQCLNEAGVDDAGMSLEEIKSTYRAIHCSRDISVTVDSEDSDNENACTSVDAKNSTDSGSTQWLPRTISATQSSESTFKYKIPKTKKILKNAPRESTNDSNSVKKPATIKPSSASTSNRLVSSAKRVDNLFAALDNGDPRDLPVTKMTPLERTPIYVPPEIAALHQPPPYNDPRVRALPYNERYAIIGKYMKDMNDMIYNLSRASSRKAVWGEPIRSSNEFKGTLDRVPPRAINDTNLDEMEIETDQFIENSKEENESTKSSASLDICVENPVEDIMEKDGSNVDSDDLQTNQNTIRKRKASDSHTDSSSDSDLQENIDDPDYEDTNLKKLSKKTSLAVCSTSTTNRSPFISRAYMKLIDNRPEITLTSSSRGKGKCSGAKSVVRTTNNTDIMARSSLFKDSPIIRGQGSNKRVLSRNRRLVNLCHADEERTVVATPNRVRSEGSLGGEEADDEAANVTVDGDFESATFKKIRVPVPVPKCRAGVVRRLPRRNPVESKQNTTNSDYITVEEEEELPCPMCNVMFKSSIIQDHAETCEGPDTANNRTITCEICDQVFLFNKDFEVHSSKCISAAKN